MASHPGVLECAIAGVPDAHSGEAVKLFLVKKDPALGEQQLTSCCSERLTAYKRPRQIEFRTELPKSMVGKSCVASCVQKLAAPEVHVPA